MLLEAWPSGMRSLQPARTAENENPHGQDNPRPVSESGVNRHRVGCGNFAGEVPRHVLGPLRAAGFLDEQGSDAAGRIDDSRDSVITGPYDTGAVFDGAQPGRGEVLIQFDAGFKPGIVGYIHEEV